MYNINKVGKFLNCNSTHCFALNGIKIKLISLNSCQNLAAGLSNGLSDATSLCQLRDYDLTLMYFFTIILVIWQVLSKFLDGILGICKSKYVTTWNFSSYVLFHHYFSDFDNFYQNFISGFQGYENVNKLIE